MHHLLKWNKVNAIARSKCVQKGFRISFDGWRAGRNAAAHIKNKGNVERCVARRGKESNLLADPILRYLEVFGSQPSDGLAIIVEHSNIEDNEVNAGTIHRHLLSLAPRLASVSAYVSRSPQRQSDN